MSPQPTGFAVTEPWPSTAGSEFVRVRSDEVLVRVGTGPAAFWALNPYSGCAFACTYCRARQQAPFAEADFRLFERSVHGRVNAAEALARAQREGVLLGSPVVLGTSCDPWQPAEAKAQLTRAALEVLARSGSAVELRAQTRSTLAPRDADLLRAIARHGKVAVSFSIGTLDLRLSRLLEPLAPTADRRLVAMEALARAGVRVGVQVAPVLAGLNDGLPALEALLRRARGAGASFASVAPLSMDAPARARLVRFVAQFDPERATRYDRLFARCAEREAGMEDLVQRFVSACDRVGIEPAPRGVLPGRGALRAARQAAPRNASAHGPGEQLELFAASASRR